MNIKNMFFQQYSKYDPDIKYVVSEVIEIEYEVLDMIRPHVLDKIRYVIDEYIKRVENLEEK